MREPWVRRQICEERGDGADSPTGKRGSAQYQGLVVCARGLEVEKAQVLTQERYTGRA
jgi:hypothetical protein